MHNLRSGRISIGDGETNIFLLYSLGEKNHRWGDEPEDILEMVAVRFAKIIMTIVTSKVETIDQSNIETSLVDRFELNLKTLNLFLVLDFVAIIRSIY